MGLLVRDMAAMIRFYRDVLGFEIREDENSPNVYLVKDGTLRGGGPGVCKGAPSRRGGRYGTCHRALGPADLLYRRPGGEFDRNRLL